MPSILYFISCLLAAISSIELAICIRQCKPYTGYVTACAHQYDRRNRSDPFLHCQRSIHSQEMLLWIQCMMDSLHCVGHCNAVVSELEGMTTKVSAQKYKNKSLVLLTAV